MFKMFLNKFTDETTKEIMTENYYEFKEQEVDFKPIQNNLEVQIKILEKLKDDLAKDLNNPFVEELTAKIDAKIETLILRK